MKLKALNENDWYRSAIEIGIDQLDRTFGKQWVHHIDLDTLNMSLQSTCLCGQLGKALESAVYSAYDRAFALILAKTNQGVGPWEVSPTSLWIKVIKELRRNRRASLNKPLNLTIPAPTNKELANA